MPIETDMPLITPATVAKTYAEVAVRAIVIEWSDPAQPITARITYGLIARDDAGVGEYHPDFAPTLLIPDVSAEAATDPEMAAVFQAVLGKAIKLAATRGVISIPQP